MDGHRLYLEHLSAIERVARDVARRYRAPKNVVEDFVSSVRLRMLENDCWVLRQYRGQSSPSTYLTTVIVRLFLDARNQGWGRWRPSARARELGIEAIALERLVYRDCLTVAEAIQTRCAVSGGRILEADLRSLWAQLPARVPKPVLVGTTEEADYLLAEWAPDPVAETEDAAIALLALSDAYTALTPSERLLLQLHFGRGVPLLHIARLWGVSRATIMRRFAKALATCRRPLREAGLTPHRLRELIRIGAIDFSSVGLAETLRDSTCRSLEDAADAERALLRRMS